MEKQGISVLLVDDDEDEYILLRDMLKRTSVSPGPLMLRIDWAATFQTALQALATGIYDAALIDYHLGEQTGLDLLRVINQRGMLSLSESEPSRARRLHQQVAVVLVDIDHFKGVNDSFGHPVGDEVLQAVAGRLRSALRNQDVLSRYRGEEFVILLPECCPVMGATIAERLRLLFDKQPVKTQAGSVNITVSLGMAIAEPPSNNLDDMLERADQALYRAKQAGRNRVEVYA